MSTRRLFGPFNRVEGDLDVEVHIEDGAVAEAWVRSPLFRGFEEILHGRDPRDALVYTPRICGICSVAQSAAAAVALAQTMSMEPPPNGRLCANLVLACENLADHLTHFYLFFMPDFARPAYEGRSWHAEIAQRFRAIRGSATAEVLPARARFLHLAGLLAGKWPHTLALQPGGSTRAVRTQEKARLHAIVRGFRRFLEERLFDDTLESFAALDSLDALEAWTDKHQDADAGRFLQLSRELELARLGVAPSRFMSYGAYPEDGGHLFARGVWDQGERPLDTAQVTEDLSHTWMAEQDGPTHPLQGTTLPDADKPGAYTWCKAPRLAGEPVEVGALARQQVDGHPLVRALVSETGANVHSRVVARLLELARVPPAMERWIASIEPAEPFHLHGEVAEEGTGIGLVEAARGSLGHWVIIRHGRILNYQIVAPTTWNFSPRDHRETPGPLEQALVGTPVGEAGAEGVAIQHVVRSYDPCMVCTVH